MTAKSASDAVVDGKEKSAVYPIDGYVVRARRIEMELAPSLLARVLGTSGEVINRLERCTVDQGGYQLRFVVQLARVLGFASPAELFAPPAMPTEGDLIDADDTSAVGALLAGQKAHVFVETLAEALGWTLARTLFALEQLEQLLVPVGQRLSWVSDLEVRLVAAPVAAAAVRTVSRRGLERGLSRNDVKALAKVMKGGSVTIDELPKPSMQRLLAADFLRVAEEERDKDASGRTGAVQLGERARFNLLVDELAEVDAELDCSAGLEDTGP